MVKFQICVYIWFLTNFGKKIHKEFGNYAVVAILPKLGNIANLQKFILATIWTALIYMQINCSCLINLCGYLFSSCHVLEFTLYRSSYQFSSISFWTFYSLSRYWQLQILQLSIHISKACSLNSYLGEHADDIKCKLFNKNLFWSSHV